MFAHMCGSPSRRWRVGHHCSPRSGTSSSTNDSSATQFITGSQITFAAISPKLAQDGTGSFQIDNDLAFANVTALSGGGSGTLTLAGILSGTGFTKTGNWNFEDMNAWLQKPSAFIAGSRMAFAGLNSDKQRADVIAYLQTLK